MKKLIQPATRGSITKAITESQLSKIAPESPRPLEMLDSVQITSSDTLTADDAALHELLVSAAYEADKDMSLEFTTLPVSTALRFLGEHARRDALKVSMRRLMSTTVSYGTKKTRRFEDVPLIFSYLESTESEDLIRYSLPEPIRILMRSMPAYAYLELAPISQMKSKYSVRLYRVLAAAAARKKWVAGADNRVIVSASLEDLYRWTGFPLDQGGMQYGKIRQRVISKLEDELATVRRFALRIEEVRKAARGRPLERVDFYLVLRAPSHKLTHVSFEKGRHKLFGYGGVDAPEYRVNSYIWQKAQREFWPVKKRMHSSYFAAWQIALQEALDADAVSPGYTQRAYRGFRLLNAIRELGPDEAAFQFCAEEVDSPDLLADESFSYVLEATEGAVEARKQRIKSKSSRKENPADRSRSKSSELGDNGTDVAMVEAASENDDGVTSSVGIQLFEELLAEEDQHFERSKPCDPTPANERDAYESDGAYKVPASAFDLGIDERTAELLAELLVDEEPEILVSARA